jgi:hypothetical protein
MGSVIMSVMREGFSRFTHHVSRLLDLFECFGPGTAASTAAVAFFDGSVIVMGSPTVIDGSVMKISQSEFMRET